MNTVKRTYKLDGDLVAGFLIAAVGILFLLRNFNVLTDPFRTLFRYWPVIIILAGSWRAVGAGNRLDRMSGMLWAAIGLLALGSTTQIVPLGLWELFMPLLLIWIGASIMMKKIRHRAPTSELGNSFSETAVLGGMELKCSSRQFEGGSAMAIMGGVEVNLREAAMRGAEATIDVMVLMGGVELRVPEGWRVVSRIIPVLGVVEDKTLAAPENENTPRLIIRGTVLMGGVEISN